MRFRFAAPLLAVALLFLAGCGPATLKTPMPLNDALLPATIYVPDCPSAESLLEALVSSDKAMGVSVCHEMDKALHAAASGFDGKVTFVLYSVGTKDAPRTFEPDKAAEASIQSRYRVILSPASSQRVYKDAGGTKGFHYSEVEASQTLSVVEIDTGKRGWATIAPLNGSQSGADTAAAAIMGGLRGPRCEVLNAFSFRASVHAVAVGTCKTFALHMYSADREAEEDAENAAEEAAEKAEEDAKAAKAAAKAAPKSAN